MERRIDLSNLDLDAVAANIAGRVSRWTVANLKPAPLTWTDNDDAWPVVLVADRRKVRRPRSLGLRLSSADGLEAELVVYAGGWADLDVGAGQPPETTHEYVELETADEIGALLDRLTARLTVKKDPQADHSGHDTQKTDASWRAALARFRELSDIPGAAATAVLLELALPKWEMRVTARTSMHDLLFTLPGDPYPFPTAVRVSRVGKDAFEFELRKNGGLLVTADRSTDATAPAVLDAFLMQLAGT